MSKHIPGVMWATRTVGTYPQQYVRTVGEAGILIEFYDNMTDGAMYEISRRDARLLARRINACLEASK